MSKKHGVVLVYSSADDEIYDDDDDNLSQLFNFIEASLRKSKVIRINKRKLHVPIESYIYSESDINNEDDLENEIISSLENLKETLTEFPLDNELDPVIFNETRAIIEGSKPFQDYQKEQKFEMIQKLS